MIETLLFVGYIVLVSVVTTVLTLRFIEWRGGVVTR